MKQPAALVVLLVALAACGGGDPDASVSGAWARATAPGATVGAVYFDVEAADDDTLLGVSVPADVAARAELHEVVPADMGDTDTDLGDMGDMGDMGAVRMRELTGGLALVGGEPVSFDPGGDHVMLPELVGALEVGDEFELTLGFQNADDVTVAVDVTEAAP
ncbi:MAG: copper chaperone PCu(A)C [Ilumatobacter sp.]